MPWSIIVTNTLAFALCFAAWVVFGPSARLIVKDLHLPATSIPLIKTIPILIGSISRVPIGMLTDRFGARLMMPTVMAAAGLALLYLNTIHTLTSLVAPGARPRRYRRSTRWLDSSTAFPTASLRRSRNRTPPLAKSAAT